VDFLHQFLGSVVPKKDKRAPRAVFGLMAGGFIQCLSVKSRIFRRGAGSRKNALDWIRRAHFDRQCDAVPVLNHALDKFMQSFKALFALFVLSAVWAQTATAQPRFGAQDVEREPNRVQQWLVPSPDTPQRTPCCFAPSATGRFGLR
jgi:hypothetical protein